MVDLGTLGGHDSAAAAVNESGEVVGEADTSSGSRHAFSWTQAGGMVDLGTLGGRESLASDVNDSGEVVGAASTSSGSQHAFSWTQAGGMVDLGTLGGRESFANDVNDSGQIVGAANRPDGRPHAAFWPLALKVVTSSLPPASRGSGYSFQLEASGGKPPYKWGKAGRLPKGLKLSKTGLLSGAPSSKLLPGEYPVRIKLADAAKPKESATATLMLRIS
jgi:probable HAF family extracellular repeat protein